MDDCVGNRCQNNATCIDGIGSYVCSCDRGYSGDFCQNKIHFCSSPGLVTNSILFCFLFVKKVLIFLYGKSMTPH